MKYIYGWFNEETKLTIGVDFFVKQVVVGDQTYALQFWDLGGQDRFQFMHSDYVKHAKCALLMVDLTNRFSLDRADFWVQMLRSSNCSLNILLVCTKLDQDENVIISDDEIAEAQAKYELVGSYKVSAKTEIKVNELFNRVVELAISESVTAPIML